MGNADKVLFIYRRDRASEKRERRDEGERIMKHCHREQAGR
jgi:hypothetical protein